MALGLVDNARSAIFPDFLKEYDLSDTSGSVFFLATSASGVIHNFVMHRFLSHTPPAVLVAIYTLVMAVSGIGIALSPTYAVTILSCVLLGFAFGGLGVGQNAAVQMAPVEVRRRAMGLLHSMYGVSSFAAPLVVSAVVATGVSWRYGLAASAIPSFLLGLGLLSIRKKSIGLGQTQESAAATPRPSTLSRQRVVATALLVGAAVVAEISISTRLTLLARRDWGFTLDVANVWLALYFAAMTAGRVALGLLPSVPHRLLPLAMVVGVPALALAFLPLGISSHIRLAAVIVFGLAVSLLYPLIMAHIAEVFAARAQYVTSTAVATQSAASMIMHFSLGWAADRMSLGPLLFAVASGALVLALVSYSVFASPKPDFP